VKRYLSLIAGALLFGVYANAESPHIRQLDDGLFYVRITAETPLPEITAEHSLVLDLRYAQSEPKLVSEWLEAAGSSPFFILINPATSAALREAVAAFAQTRAALTIGPSIDTFTPDISLAIDLEEEAQAYAAFTEEANLAALIGASESNKYRYDEASVIAAHGQGKPIAENPEPTPSFEESSHVVDLALQRAIHLHRAWRALKPRS